jgi:WYL domain
MGASDHARAQVFSRSFPATFDAKEYLEGAWGILRGDLVTVRVLFSKAVARYIAERLWHPSQKLRELDDGRLEVTLRVADTLEVRRWILGYGVHAEALEPATLREALRADAEALVATASPRSGGRWQPRPPPRDDPQLARAMPWQPPAPLADHRREPSVSPSVGTQLQPGPHSYRQAAEECRDERKSRITDDHRTGPRRLQV